MWRTLAHTCRRLPSRFPLAARLLTSPSPCAHVPRHAHEQTQAQAEAQAHARTNTHIWRQPHVLHFPARMPAYLCTYLPVMNTDLYVYICTFTCIPCDVLRCIGRLDFERRRWALSRTEVHTPKVSYECLFRCIWRILKRLETYLELKFLRPAEVPTRPLDEYPAARIDVIGRAPSSAPVPAASTHTHTSSVRETHHHVASAFMSAHFFSRA